MDGTEPGDIRTVLFLYVPANGLLVDWKSRISMITKVWPCMMV